MRCSRRALLGGALACALTPAPARAGDPFARRLVRIVRGQRVAATVAPRFDHVALYFGAGWCGPCRVFVPELIAAYPRLIAAVRPIEIVFVSDDAGCRAQHDYAMRTRMPWPMLACDDPARAAIRARGGAALPGLALIARGGGGTLFDSWRGGHSYPRDALARLIAFAEKR